MNPRQFSIINICALLVIMLASACSSPTPQVQVVEITRLVPQTVVVTQLVTMPPPTPAATLPAPPTATPTPPKTERELWYPLIGCPPSHLKIGDVAYVTLGGTRNAIRKKPDIADINIIGFADRGENVTIIGGPECSYDYLLWLVETSTGLIGYTPETDGKEFWLVTAKP